MRWHVTISCPTVCWCWHLSDWHEWRVCLAARYAIQHTHTDFHHFWGLITVIFCRRVTLKYWFMHVCMFISSHMNNHIHACFFISGHSFTFPKAHNPKGNHHDLVWFIIRQIDWTSRYAQKAPESLLWSILLPKSSLVIGSYSEMHRFDKSFKEIVFFLQTQMKI